MPSKEVKLGEICAGYGGIGMGLSMLTPVRTAWVADIDKGPRMLWEHHAPDIPNHGDITRTDWHKVEPVDVIAGGTPCQDLSVAGHRRGMKPGTRSGIWESMANAISIIRPKAVIWENVTGALSAPAFTRSSNDSSNTTGGMGPGSGRMGGAFSLRALGRVLGDLAELGYDAQWVTVRASDAGAPHQRARVFVLAHPADSKGVGLDWARSPRGGRTGPANRSGELVGLLPTVTVTDMGSSHTPETRDAWTASMRAKHGNGNGHGASLSIEARRPSFGAYKPAISRWEKVIGWPAPAPSEPADSKTGRRLSARFAEWMMGLPEGHVTEVPGLAYGQQIRLLGNGVVPQQCALALSTLADWSRMQPPPDTDELGTTSLLELI